MPQNTTYIVQNLARSAGAARAPGPAHVLSGVVLTASVLSPRAARHSVFVFLSEHRTRKRGENQGVQCMYIRGDCAKQECLPQNTTYMVQNVARSAGAARAPGPPMAICAVGARKPQSQKAFRFLFFYRQAKPQARRKPRRVVCVPCDKVGPAGMFAANPYLKRTERGSL